MDQAPTWYPRRSIAVILPAFDEAARIEQTIAAIGRYQRLRGSIREVYLADDGSTDATVEVATRAAADVGLTLSVLRGPHRGKASTVRAAMLSVADATTCDYLMMLDADNEIGVEQLDSVPWSDDPMAIYIGRRVARAAGAVGVVPTPWRRLMSGAMRFASRLLLGIALPDTQCGFKLYPRAAARELFAQQRSRGWDFDAEILYIAGRVSGLPILEVPVTWRPRGTSKVRASAAISSALGLLATGARRLRGVYHPIEAGRVERTDALHRLRSSEVG